MIDDERKRLRELAEKATPGPWEAVLEKDERGQPVPYYRGLIALLENGDRYLSVVNAGSKTVEEKEWEPNCSFIAAASPDVVLKLLDELDKYKELERRRMAAIGLPTIDTTCGVRDG